MTDELHQIEQSSVSNRIFRALREYRSIIHAKMSTLYYQASEYRNKDPRFSIASITIMLYIIITYTQGYQDENIEKWTNRLLLIGILGWCCCYCIFWVIPNRFDIFGLKDHRSQFQNFLRICVRFSAIISISAALLFILLSSSSSILESVSFIFAVISCIGGVSLELSFGSHFTPPDFNRMIRMLRDQARLNNVIAIYPLRLKPTARFEMIWRSTTEINSDIIFSDNNSGAAEELDQFPVTESGFFLRTSAFTAEESKHYYCPATKSKMSDCGFIGPIGHYKTGVLAKVEINSLSHLMLAMISDCRNRWNKYSVSNLIRGLHSVKVGDNLITHSWTRNEIAESATHIKDSIIGDNKEHPIPKWFEIISQSSLNDELLLRYISLLSKYNSGSIWFGDHKWDAMVIGFSQVCKIAEYEDILKHSISSNRTLRTSFEHCSQREVKVSRKPVEEFVKIHDIMIDIGLTEAKGDNESPRLLFIEKVIQKMMERIHQTVHLEGRPHRAKQLIERRKGLIAGTVLGLEAVTGSLDEFRGRLE